MLQPTVRIQVAVGILYNAHQQILIAKRHIAQHQGDCWEFPGGKIEPGETPAEALKRELFEEVGVSVITHEPLIVVDYDYPDKAVQLIVHRVTHFQGTVSGKEGQPIRWVYPHELTQFIFPQANHPILEAIITSTVA